MPRRSTVKRIDYSKFGASGSSSASDDDDFEIISAPPKKQKLTTKDEKERVKNKTVDKGKSDTITATKVKTKNTRTSIAETVCKTDLLTALEISKSELQHNETTTEHAPINDDPIVTIRESDDERVMKIIKGQTGTQGSTSNIDSEGSAFADTLPISDRKDFYSDEKQTTSSSCESPVKPSHLKEDKRNKENTSDSSELKDKKTKCTSMKRPTARETLRQPRVETIDSVQKVHSAPPSAKASPKPSSSSKASPSSHNTSAQSFTILTPGRLRLGLSRNVRVSKPLHQNMNFKMS